MNEDAEDADVPADRAERSRANFSVVASIVESVEGRIKAGLYAPGDRLVTADIQTMLDASRGTVREALRQLAADGVVEFSHNKGARIRKWSVKELLDTLSVRGALEELSVRLAAERIEDGDNRDVLLHLRDKNLNAEITASNFHEINDDFHDTIVAISGNLTIAKVINQLRMPLYVINYFRPSRASTSIREHLQMIDAIEAGDGESAQRVMRGHVGRTREYILRAMLD